MSAPPFEQGNSDLRSLNIFSGLLYSCNDGDQTGLTSCTGEYAASPVDDSLAFLTPRVWANPTLNGSKWAFDSFRQSILILFEIVSLEGWIDVMSSAMNISGRDQQPVTNIAQWNSIFFLLYNLLGVIIILALFVRYVSFAFEDLPEADSFSVLSSRISVPRLETHSLPAINDNGLICRSSSRPRPRLSFRERGHSSQ